MAVLSRVFFVRDFIIPKFMTWVPKNHLIYMHMHFLQIEIDVIDFYILGYL